MPLTLVPPKAGRTPNYRIRGTYLGIRVDRSAETRDKTKARKLLAAIEAAIERGAFAQKPALTLAAAVTAYVQAGGESRFLGPILRHFGKGATVEEVDQVAADAAAAAIYPRARAATRNRQFYTPLLAVLGHAGVTARIKRPKGAAGDARTAWLRPEQFERLAKAAAREDMEFACLLTLLVFTGLRLGEALGLQCQDLDLKRASAFCGKTKNGEPREVYLPLRVVASFANHPRGLDRDERLFRWTKSGELYLLAERFYAAANVDHGGAPFHVLRHTYGAWMTRVGADLVGTGAWKSPTAARVYQHFSVNEEARKADALPGSRRAPRVRK
jgi:integrase